MFSARSAVPAGIALVKFLLVLTLAYSAVKQVVADPVFTTSVSLPRFVEFLAASALGISMRVMFAVGIIAAADYGYQFWRNNRDLMMTKQEVKDEMKNTEGNPQIKARRRRRWAARNAHAG